MANGSADDLANRLTSLAESLRQRGVPEAGSSRNDSQSSSETLARLFPSSSSSRVLYTASSSSRSKRVVPYSKGKGKSTSVSVIKDVILLPNPKITDVPRGKTREELYIRKLVYPAFELSNEMSSTEITDKISSFFQRRLKGRHYDFVRSVGNKIVAAGISRESISGRVIKHLSGQGPIYIRCITPIEKDFDWGFDEEDEETSSDDEKTKITIHTLDEDDGDLLKSPLSLSTASTSSSSLSDSALKNGPSTSSSTTSQSLDGPQKMQACPTCNNLFTMSEIEAHADFCCSTLDNDKKCILKDTCSVIGAISKKVDNSEQMFLVLRRGCPLERVLDIWKRAVKKKPSCLEKRVVVSFIGEQGIDSGAIASEFFTIVLHEMAKIIFKDGVPIDSTFHVQNLNFVTCGQIVVASLAQGGPPPCFLDESAYNLMLEKSPKLHNIDRFKHLSETDREFLNTVAGDLQSHTDTIVDHGYTGLINADHKDEIMQTMAISIVSKRLLYLREFMDGMQSYGLAELIQKFPSICKPLFVKSSTGKVDANYVFSILQPNYSPESTTRQQLEEAAMDMFQDFLFKLEDEDVSGYEEALVSCQDESTEMEFQKPDLTPAGVLGWLTGQKHRPLGNEDLAISVTFNHDCLKENPKHKICYPLVGACAKEIILPLAHMSTTKQFQEVFITAMSKGQAFGKA